VNAIWTVFPVLLIRYALPNLFDKDALKRLAYFPPLIGKEKWAFWVYQLTNAAMMLQLYFLEIKISIAGSGAGAVIYLVGLIGYGISVGQFSKPSRRGIITGGLYKRSRNPMYIAYFIIFVGCVVLTGSFSLLMLLFTFQISVHWLILAEERWCLETFGSRYQDYMDQVGRYY
jgi:protein-S-isoprenylcysteine O-methyltransferase Ste14